MKKIAHGGFEIEGWDEKPAGITVGPKVTRATVTQRFTGDIKGTGTTEYLMVYRPDKTADYSGVQVVTAPLASGRAHSLSCFGVSTTGRSPPPGGK